MDQKVGVGREKTEDKTFFSSKEKPSCQKKALRLSENALIVLKRRYLKKNEKGEIVETPEELFTRVAHHIASAENMYHTKKGVVELEEQFYSMMAECKFLPNSPTLMNAGRPLGQLSACFVLPIDDSMESIFETLKNTAIIHKSGGGTGFSFSRLRPVNDIVQSTKGISSGPVSFMKVFDSATEAVKQGGTRRGANMGVLRVDHPDILDFIACKKENDKITNFNISIGVTEKFMKAVENSSDYELINPRSKKCVEKLNARTVFNTIVDLAWCNGEPGIIFLDRINKDNPTPKVGEIESTNPCGEQPLLPHESCNLGSINLSNFVVNGHIDYKELERIVKLTVCFLDNVIDMNKFPLPIIEKTTKASRKIGLGVMGFADMLIKLGISYASEEGILMAERIMSFIDQKSKEASVELAQEKGVFPNFAGSVYDSREGMPMRNATTTTIAPTGTISILGGCSSGVEPLFGVAFVRNVMDNDKLVEVNPLFEEIAKREGFYSAKLMEKIAQKGSLKDIPEISEHYKRIFVTAHDVSPEYHMKMQAAFQKFTDNAVSKTVNFPHSATREDVAQVYLLAYALGCKGVTIYRDGSRDQQVLTKGSQVSESKESKDASHEPMVKRMRPKTLIGRSIQMETGCGPLYVTINEDEKGLFELFNNIGKAGGCAGAQSEAIGRLVSLAWRSGVAADSIIKQLIGISCHRPKGIGNNKMSSCADAIAKAIRLYLKDKGTINISPVVDEIISRGACPECGGVIEHEGGCAVCRACAFSECG
ncbi:MAG: vitamin B12-dependent ribonucleotide reductase [Candidatus Omnitrophica bacterium]|nr:vitamin B12-dependent ribonucleotide reductase [Candidatus Omnitrophota bacterium]